jgi:riboflavin kinase/FMN adenylyltransferase
MIIRRWDELDALAAAPGSPAAIRPSAATIGVFDGVHKGHQELIRRVLAHAPALMPVAVTFSDHPKHVTAPERYMGMLQSLEQKLSTLEALGIELCVLIDFSGNFSKLGGNEFVSTLIRSCGVRFFAVGSDFKCGHRLSTDAFGVRDIARSLDAEVDIVEPVLVDGERVSSSLIRSELAKGRTDRAYAMLGRPYTLDLRAVEREYSGSTIKLLPRVRGYVLPRNGQYAARILTAEGSRATTVTVCSSGVKLDRTSDAASAQFLEFVANTGYTE